MVKRCHSARLVPAAWSDNAEVVIDGDHVVMLAYVTNRFPTSRLLYRLFAGGATRLRVRAARRAGVLSG
jgi:hypothetical protein